MRLDATLLVLLLLGYFATPRHVSGGDRMEFPGGGFSIELPTGWTGPVATDEERLPAASSYLLRHAGDGPLTGSQILVVRRANLNPLQRQQWMRGRAAVGLGDLRPVEALSGDAMPFQEGVGYRAQGGGRQALVYFTQHAGTHYAFVASAPAQQFVAATGALLAAVGSVRFL